MEPLQCNSWYLGNMDWFSINLSDFIVADTFNPFHHHFIEKVAPWKMMKMFGPRRFDPPIVRCVYHHHRIFFKRKPDLAKRKPGQPKFGPGFLPSVNQI